MKNKNAYLVALCLMVANISLAQSYRYTFHLDGLTDTMLYIAQHYTDQLQVLDSASVGKNGNYVFTGSKTLPTGIYALVRADRKTQLGDFCVEGERTFSISSDASFSPSKSKAKGSEGNRLMFDYKATVSAARSEMDAIQKRLQVGDTTAEAARRALVERMERYESRFMQHRNHLYPRLTALSLDPVVPDTVSDKATFYRMHYWDSLASFLSRSHTLPREALYSPQLFNRVNYFFFGHLYYADSDTIGAALDRLMSLVGNDTALCRYILEYITPKYYRSTRNIGWDAVWCHIAEHYYLAGRCPWATEGTITSTRLNYLRIRQSIIGAHGQELWMLDTTQVDTPEHWLSSHRQAKPYVVLWFWDPDCHHCQKYTAELKTLYDTLPPTERKFEVYAVGYESDVQKWKNYVRDHQLPFVNVGGPNVNIDYQEAYNVHGAPTMIILDPKRNIILNKVIPIDQLCQFIDNYEQKQAASH